MKRSRFRSPWINTRWGSIPKFRRAPCSPSAPELNDYVGRLSYLLQHGRHVADVAVLYPIGSLQASYRFMGGRTVPAGAE